MSPVNGDPDWMRGGAGELLPGLEPDTLSMTIDLARRASLAQPDAVDPLRRLTRLVSNTAAVAEAVDAAARVERDAHNGEAGEAGRRADQQLAGDLAALMQAVVAVAEQHRLTDHVRAQIRRLWLDEHRRRPWYGA